MWGVTPEPCEKWPDWQLQTQLGPASVRIAPDSISVWSYPSILGMGLFVAVDVFAQFIYIGLGEGFFFIEEIVLYPECYCIRIVPLKVTQGCQYGSLLIPCFNIIGWQLYFQWIIIAISAIINEWAWSAIAIILSTIFFFIHYRLSYKVRGSIWVCGPVWAASMPLSVTEWCLSLISSMKRFSAFSERDSSLSASACMWYYSYGKDLGDFSQ